MMTILTALILGIVQGLTEFLPISSSGHLVIFQHFLGVKEPGIYFEVVLHLGTLVSIFIVFWKDIVGMIKVFFTLFSKYKFRTTQEQRSIKLMKYIILGSIPTAIIGFLLAPVFEGFFESVYLVGWMLLITGIILWIADRTAHGRKEIFRMKGLDAIIIGIAQGAAITPGISRSGSTIAAGLLLGLNRETATRYSFLLSIPAVVGASIFKLKDLFEIGTVNISFVPLIVAAVSSIVFGVIAILLVMKALKQGKLKYFSYYCWLLGIFIILSQIL